MEDSILRGNLKQRIALDSQMIGKFETIVNDGTLSRSIDSGMAKYKLQQDKEAKERRDKRREEQEKKEAEKSGKKATKLSTLTNSNSNLGLGRVIQRTRLNSITGGLTGHRLRETIKKETCAFSIKEEIEDESSNAGSDSLSDLDCKSVRSAAVMPARLSDSNNTETMSSGDNESEVSLFLAKLP